MWAEWSTNNGQPSPFFNWLSVFIFNVSPNCLAFTLDWSGRSQTLLLIRLGHIVRCDNEARDPLVYVAFLEAAPWNRTEFPGRLHRGLGSVMLRAASDFSLQSGYGDRVGLHSVAAAEGFYRQFGFQGLDCPNEYNEMYYELSERRAQVLLSD